MACEAAIREVQGVAIVDLSGRVVLGDGSQVIRDTVKDLLAKGKKNVVLNLGGVSYVDSAGLGEMVGCYVSALNQGGQLKLLHALERVNDVLMITKLTTIFEIFSDETEAVRSFPARVARA